MNMDITTPLLSLEKKCFHTLYVNIIVDENSQKLANPLIIEKQVRWKKCLK